MRLSQSALLYAVDLFLVVSVACMYAGNELGSSSSWQYDLAQAQDSGVPPFTYSSDEILASAGSELDHELQQVQQLVRDQNELSALVSQFRQHEKGYVKTYYKDLISYEPRSPLSHLTEPELATAMKEHFKPGQRNIAVLNADTAVTAHVYQKKDSKHILKWGLNEADSHVFFWRLNPEKDQVTFKGIATVSPNAVVRYAMKQLPKLTLAPNKQWDYLGFTFHSPNRLEFRGPLVAKPVL